MNCKNVKYIKLAVIIMAASILFSSCASNEAETENTERRFTAGYGECELSVPDVDCGEYYIAGYKNNNPATGVLDWQYARALWLDDCSGEGGLLFIVVDCVGLARADVSIIRSTLDDFVRESGCRAVNVISTHTHAGIDTLGLWGPVAVDGKNDTFQQIVYDGAVAAAKAAYADRRAGKLYYGTAENASIQDDSRIPEVFDKTLYRFRFEPDDGSEGIILINFAAHPEALYSSNSLVSADFPRYAADIVTEATGSRVLYISGAIGGLIATVDTYGADGERLSGYENMLTAAKSVADTALSVENERELAPEVGFYTEKFKLTLDNDVFIAMSFLGVLSAQPVSGGGRHSLALESELSLLEIDGVKALLVPGELFPELAYGGFLEDGAGDGVNPPTYKEIFGGNILVFGLANDEIGYIVPPNDFFIDETQPYLTKGVDETGRGHYEETNSVGRETASELADAAEKLAIRADSAREN